MSGSTADIGPAILLGGAGFLMLGVLAYVAERIARHKLQAQIQDARDWLRQCSWTAAVYGTSANYSDLYEAYSMLQQLRWELGQL